MRNLMKKLFNVRDRSVPTVFRMKKIINNIIVISFFWFSCISLAYSATYYRVASSDVHKYNYLVDGDAACAAGIPILKERYPQDCGHWYEWTEQRPNNAGNYCLIVAHLGCATNLITRYGGSIHHITCAEPTVPSPDYTTCIAPEYFLAKLDLNFDYKLNEGNQCGVNTRNPINTASGNKYRSEIDLTPSGSSPIKFTRSYNSLSNTASQLGSGWRHNYSASSYPIYATQPSVPYIESSVTNSALYSSKQQACESGWNQIKGQYRNTNLKTALARFEGESCKLYSLDNVFLASIKVQEKLFGGTGGGTPSTPQTLSGRILIRADGSRLKFNVSGAGQYTAVSDVNAKLEDIPNGIRYTAANGAVEDYDNNGKLLSITSRTGITQTLSYNAKGLSSVTDSFGNTLGFNYDTASSKLTGITLPNQSTITYTQDVNDNLETVTREDTTTRTYHYEDTRFANALTGITNGNNERHMTFSYDAQGRAITSELAGGAERVTINFVDENTSTVTDALEQIRTYRFTTINGVKKLTDIEGAACTSCGGGATHTTYDANGYIASSTDFNDNVTAFVNDARGLPTTRTEAVGTTDERVITTTWHATYALPLSITAPGSITDFTYDVQGNVLTRTQTDTTNQNTRVVTYTYNSIGQVLTVDGTRTDVTDLTTYTYDAKGHLATVTNALSHTTQITAYDLRNRPLTLIDANGLTTTLGYDTRGRVTSRTVTGDSNSLTTTFSYDGAGNLESILLPDGQSLTYDYDAAHRLVGLSDQLGNRITYTLDALGNRLSENVNDATNTLVRTQSQVFNMLSQLTQSIGAQNQTIEYGYDLNGNRLTTTDAANKTTISAFDALNRVTSVTDPLNGLAIYGYDNQGNLTSVTDANGAITTYGYDGFNNRISQTSQDTGTATYTVDEAGNVLSQTDAKSQTTSYQYDVLNRLTLTTYADNTTITYTYDQGVNQLGRLTAMNTNSLDKGTSSLSYDYDIFGRMLTKTQTVNGVNLNTAYSYDLQGRMSSMTYPSGSVVTYHYANGQLSGLDVNGQPLLSDITYEAFGAVKGWTWGNGSIHSRGFDLDGQLISQSLANDTRTLGYDVKGNITTINDAQVNQLFAYDELNRLTAANDASLISGFNQVLDYDANGNRLSLTDASVTDSYGYDASITNRLTSITGNTVKTYQYDANGNIIHDGLHDYGYDARNRLASVDTLLATYQHNALGQRVQKSAAGNNTVFYYNEQGQLISEADSTGFVSKEYLYLGNQPIAVRSVKRINQTFDSIIDNLDAGVLLIGNWKSSTSVAGFEGLNYSFHAANGMPASSNIIDNGSAGFSAIGTWKASTSVAGYEGANYSYHAANSMPASSLIIDNSSAAFSVTGTWKASTSVKGYEGANYQHHYANGASPGSYVIDNAAGIAVGTWPTSTSVKGYEAANYQHHTAGTGLNTFTWSTGVTTTGDYNVYAKWTAHANRASNATYTVQHTAGETPVSVNQQAQGSQWVLLGQFNLDSASQVILSDNANGYVIADGIMVAPLNAEPNTATWLTAATTAGVHTVYAKWTAHANRASNASYTVHHVDGTTTVVQNQRANGGEWVALGDFNLDATSKVTLTDVADGYVIADAIAITPQDAPANQATWQLGVTTQANYALYAKWTAHANRASNASYTVHHVDGTTTVTQNQKTNGGLWIALGEFNLDANSKVTLTDQADGYVIADAVAVSPIGAAPNQAIWQLNVPAQGDYDLYAKWTAHANRASDAPYNVSHVNGETPITVNQQTQGSQWNLLGNFSFDPNSTVSLSDQANGYVIADALRVVGTVTNTTQTTLHYIHTDHLGTPRVITDENNTTLWSWHSDPFGKTAANDDVDGDGKGFEFNLRFPGQYADEETGLHYNYFRDYDPSTGRYVQSDPIGLDGGLNTYGYVGGNPLGFTDPKGLHYYQRNGSYVPHTHTYPSNGPYGGVDFSAKDKGMLEPFSIEHYNLPSCIKCDEQFSSCLGGSASVDCTVCSATGNPIACTKCAISGVQAGACVVQHCKEGKKGQDGSCLDPKTCK